MAIGETYPSEARVFKDPVTGVQIRQLTDYMCHSNHLYFTIRVGTTKADAW